MDRNDDNLDLPRDLKSALRGLHGSPPPFRGDNQAILAAARAAGMRRRNALWGRWAVGIGMAAAVAIAAMIVWPTVTRVEMAHRAATPLATHVPTGDIRDAFYVARQLKVKHPLAPRWDHNADGTVDEKDVQLLAAAAVRIESPSKGATQ